MYRKLELKISILDKLRHNKYYIFLGCYFLVGLMNATVALLNKNFVTSFLVGCFFSLH